jgi:preprotein translocase subunit SecA
LPKILDSLLRAGEGRLLKKLQGYAAEVNALEADYNGLSDEELRDETRVLRERYGAGESLDDLLPEAFAAVREAAVRTIGLRHFDVQLMGGAALHLGNISEMKTGEGKTLVATLAAYLNAIPGRGVHIVTVNDFLASYQSELMGRVFRALGMTTGCLINGQDPETRRAQYACDITYGTNNEFGFDYLRDNMALAKTDLVQRGHFYAIVDEVDSILIDEARTPLIISGPAAADANRWFGVFAKLVKTLERDIDYEVDEKKRTVGVLESGIEKVEDYLGIENLYQTQNTPLISFLNNAIRAKELFKIDKDYVVINGEVQIVDEHTGRVLAGRRYNEGMHQAIEAKEEVAIKAENQTLATITLQNYFRLYSKLSGMTGTAETEAAEFMSTYKLGVVPIPTNREMIRADRSDLIYKNEKVKFAMVVEDIAERHATGQPILVGTTSVEKSEYLSGLLAKRGIRHEVLNAKNNAREAVIVAQAGRLNAVTVATNMAGRGTDIMLGGNAEFLAVQEMERLGLNPSESPVEYEAAWDEIFATQRAKCATEAEAVLAAGGLYVLGTERHESRRIDNQLRGRSGRQGDPGESRFYLSLTDDLMRLFNSGAAAAIMSRSSVPDDSAIESKMVSKAIASAQSQVEGRNAEIRKNILKYDDVMNRQREAIYQDRRRILEGDDISETVADFLEATIREVVNTHTLGGEFDLEALWVELKTIYPIGLEISEVLEEVGRAQLTSEWLAEEILSDAKLAYRRRTEEFGEELMRDLERRVMLSVVDRKWRDHLYEMDYLKEGIGLRAMAQRDPLVEYQREGFVMFQQMMAAVREESITFLFNLEIKQAEVPELTPQPAQLVFSAPSEQGGVSVQRGDTASNQVAPDRKAGPKPVTRKPPPQPPKPQTGPGSSFFKN